MRLKNLWVLMLLMAGMTSCKYDDSELKEDVRRLDERISAMENTVKQMNADIVSIQGVVSALEKNVYVERLEELSDGYTIYFTDGTTASIHNGKDGKDGEDGKDGADGKDGEDGKDGVDGKDGEDGKDGVDGADGEDGKNGTNGKDAPVIGVGLDNGVYYWTVTVNGKTTWLEGEDGVRLRVTGETGVAGITPKLRIDAEGYWEASYDNGKTYTHVLNTSGEPISALGTKGDKGDTGDTGNAGSAGDSFFKNVTENEDAVILTLADGKVISIPKVKPFGIAFSQIKNILIGSEELSLSYSITGADADTFVEVYAVGGLTVTHVSASQSAGTIKVKATDGFSAENSKIIVLLCNKERTITTVLTFVTEKDEQPQGGAENYETETKDWD